MYHLGLHDCEDEAALIYNYFANKHYKEFAKLNQNIPEINTEEISERITKLCKKHNL